MNKQHGVSLIELIIFIVIISIGVAGILSIFNISIRNSADPLIKKQSLLIAEAMMEEVLSKSFAAASSSVIQTERKEFENIYDYANFTSSGIKALDGITPITGLEKYNLSVAISADSIGGIPATDIRKITVTVTNGGDTVQLTGYRTKYD